MSHINRRVVLSAAASLLWGEFVGSTHATAAAQNVAWLEESGIIHGNEAFVVAALSVTDPEIFVNKIHPILNDHKFRIRLKYRSTNKYKLSLTKELIDAFTASSGVKFVADVILQPANRQWPTDPLVAGATMVRVYERLLHRIPKRNTPITVFRKSRSARDRYVDAAIRNTFSPVPNIAKSPDGVRMVEFLNVLAGSLHRQFSGNKGNKTKDSISAYLIDVVNREKMKSHSNWEVVTRDKLVF